MRKQVLLVWGYKGSSCFNTGLTEIAKETGDREILSTICCHLEERVRDPSGFYARNEKNSAHFDGLGPRAISLYKGMRSRDREVTCQRSYRTLKAANQKSCHPWVYVSNLS